MVMKTHHSLIHARVKAWVLKQRADVGKMWANDPILNKNNWEIGSASVLDHNTWRFPVTYCDNLIGDGYYDPSYTAYVYIDCLESKVTHIEWKDPACIPDAVKKAPEPPPDYGVWS